MEDTQKKPMPGTQSSTVRISEKAQTVLRHYASRYNRSMQDILDEAIELYRRRKILEDTNLAYAILRENKEAWKEEIQERDVWDSTIGDGIDD